MRIEYDRSLEKKGFVHCKFKDAKPEHRKLISPSKEIVPGGDFFYIPKEMDSRLSIDGCESVVIILDALSKLTLSYSNSRNCSIFLKESSNLELSSLSTEGDSESNITCFYEKDSKSNIIFGVFGGEKNKLLIDNELNGEGSEAYVNGVFFSDREQVFDISTNSNHNTRNTKGDIIVKGALLGSSNVKYTGKIKILKAAQQTNSFLQNHNLLLSSDCKCDSIPSLEIDANDVKASHGATIGKPDDEDMFYLMSRGLRRKEAEKLIILGFFSKVIEKISQEDVKEKFLLAINEKVLA